MKYRHVPEKQDYSHYAGGRVLVAAPGHPAFPVRLASEIFQRCAVVLERMGKPGPYHVYDPCCGGGYLLTTLAYLHREQICHISASDIDEKALSYARRNLSLLSLDGLNRRIAEISEMQRLYGKTSHAEAIESGLALKRRLQAHLQTGSSDVTLFRADATDPQAARDSFSTSPADMVITDIPYGLHSDWAFDSPMERSIPNPLYSLLDALSAVISPQSVVAIIASKAYSVHHTGYSSVGRLKIGKRQVYFLSPA